MSNNFGYLDIILLGMIAEVHYFGDLEAYWVKKLVTSPKSTQALQKKHSAYQKMKLNQLNKT